VISIMHAIPCGFSSASFFEEFAMSKCWMSVRRAVGGVSLVAVMIGAAVAQPADGRGPGGGGGRGGHGGGCEPAAMAPSVLPMGPGLDRMLEDIKATTEQRDQIRKIVQQARQAEQDSQRSTHEQLLQAFVAADAKQAEAARQQTLSRHDAASKRANQVMLDVAKVLSAEQRKQLVERLKQRPEGGPDRDGAASGAPRR
jgi:periplasmic protein CpxP/Spy